jgi:hypothetical protein
MQLRNIYRKQKKKNYETRLDVHLNEVAEREMRKMEW